MANQNQAASSCGTPVGARRPARVAELRRSAALLASALLASWACTCQSFSTSAPSLFAHKFCAGKASTTATTTRAGFSDLARVSHGRGLKMYGGPEKAAEQAINVYTGAGDVEDGIKGLELDMVLMRSYLKLDQHIRYSTDRISPLMVAVNMQRAEMVRVMLALGANAEERNEAGETPLMLAAKRGDTDTVKVLLMYGASALARDINGDTALIHAARMGEAETVELLRKPAMSLHHLYSPPHFKAFLWLTGAGMFSQDGEVSGEQMDQVREIVMSHKAIPLCKMNLDMVSINAALRLDRKLLGIRSHNTSPPPTSPASTQTTTSSVGAAQ